MSEKTAKPEVPMFLGFPERWLDTPHWRCANGHVSTAYLKSEARGDLCLACLEPLWLTFPEDKEGDLLGAELLERFEYLYNHRPPSRALSSDRIEEEK